ncbi:haloacid dehalogenase type II [Pseudarthrobacter sp. MM222]|uniref:haloacid dehalogenase type II n=1 Tax=Pseudarthrobacter sp. MM222 TaxID=3018929 RepID=UPI00221E3EEB|nr:haloacid dehalogenase type II [Pseudarthrobacter sp. MM222]
MNTAPSVIVFDVNETLSDMSPMGQRFAEVGAPAELAKLWFATLLRDGFALTAAGGNGAFAEIGAEVLRGLLAAYDIGMDLDHAVAHVMAGMAGLGLHPDVPEGVRALRAAGYRLVTLSNGSTRVAEKLIVPAGIRDQFERLLSVEDAPGWKPAATAYHFASGACGVEPGEMLLVAVHPWDIHGAARAGLGTAWITRTGADYPDYFAAPDYTVASLAELPEVLGHAAQTPSS